MNITQTMGATAASGFWGPQIIAAVITGVIALITGSVVSFFAWRQWRVAREKLALDLFDRRAKAVMAAQKSIKEFDFAIRNTSRIATRRDAKKMSMDFRESTFEVRYLFGPEVLETVRRIANQMIEVGDAHYTYPNSEDFRVVMGVLDDDRITFLKQTDRYMNFGKIGVAKPPKRPAKKS
ncbi:MAG: hypothetical protein ACK4UQ_06525 [Brevundimonas sp.]